MLEHNKVKIKILNDWETVKPTTTWS